MSHLVAATFSKLLQSVAELDSTATELSVSCLEIAQLCGRGTAMRHETRGLEMLTLHLSRTYSLVKVPLTQKTTDIAQLPHTPPLRLPLCLNIVGNLIRTFGGALHFAHVLCYAGPV